MNTKKKLLESLPTDPEVLEFQKRMETEYHPFVAKWMKNLKETAGNTGGGTVEPEIGVIRGQTVGDAINATNYQAFATLEIFNAVIRGFTRYLDDSFCKKYVTNSVIFKVPMVEYRELAAGISAGEFPHTEKTIDYATVDLSAPESEKGAKVTWTRSLLEDITFDVQAELLEGLGQAIAVRMNMDVMMALMGVGYKNKVLQTAALQAAYVAAMPHGTVRTISSPITWADFLAMVGDVDIGTAVDNTVMAGSAGTYLETGETWNTHKTYGPADFFLCSPEIYWQLLNIIQLTNVLYEGSTDPINSGRIKLALGVTIVKCGMLPTGFCFAVNSQKAIALVTRRSLKLEPVLFPVWNEYGFIGTVRYGTTVIFPGAIQMGSTSGLAILAET